MNPLRMPQDHINEIKNKLNIPTIQEYGRHEIWMLTEHIDALEAEIKALGAEIKRGEKSAEFLQSAVVDYVMATKKKPTRLERLIQKIKGDTTNL